MLVSIQYGKDLGKMISIIDNLSLAEAGRQRMRWFMEQMPLIASLKETYRKEQPFRGLKVAICLHVEPKTAFWIDAILTGGAEHIYLVGCLGTTKPDTAAYLASDPRITVLAKEKDTLEDHQRYLEMVMEQRPDLFLDNGASLILAYHKKERDWVPLGANEETRTGRLLIDDSGYEIRFPVIVIDDSPLKKLLENAVGVGQSVVDGFMRCTSLLLGGKRILVIGYGWCGSGIAGKFRAMGAHTSVYDIDPVYLLKAKVDGHHVSEDLNELISHAEVIVTSTGRFHVITKEHIPFFSDGLILSNAGHFGFEIDTDDLRAAADRVETVGDGKEALWFGEKKIFLLENANPLNLSAGDGNPIPIMDLGLGLQASCGALLASGKHNLHNGVQPIPREIDCFVSRRMLHI